MCRISDGWVNHFRLAHSTSPFPRMANPETIFLRGCRELVVGSDYGVKARRKTQEEMQ
jgi:hypothetical protein